MSEKEAGPRMGSTVPGAILGVIALLAVLGGFVYLCDWLVQPNTPEQMCAEVVDEAFASVQGAPISVSGSASVEATSIGEDSLGFARREVFLACLARYASAPYRSRQGWWR